MVDYSIKKRLTHTITVHPFVLQDGAGDCTYAAPVVLKGFAFGHTKLVRNAEGEEVLSQKTIYVDYAVKLKDLVEIGAVRYPIIVFNPWVDENGESSLVEVLV